MTQYLLSVHGADDGAEPAEPMRPDQFQEVLALEEEMKAAGAWLFSGRLTDPEVATVVRPHRG